MSSSGDSNSKKWPSAPYGSTFSLPKVLVFKPLPAWNSPQVDERCFIYCSQTSRNRARGSDPWCRTICFRRVYGHEVADGSYNESNDVNWWLKPEHPLPLPHEGQPREAFIDGEVEDTEKTKYWKEGRYVWVSKNRWAAQEKLDSMKASLPSQTEWMRYKEKLERQRYEEEMEILRQRVRQHNERESEVPEVDDMDADGRNDRLPPDHPGYDEPELPPSAPDSLRFTPANSVRESLLFPVTPLSNMIQEALHQKLSFVLSPTYKLLTVFQRSFTEGTQSRFLAKAYQQATNGSTILLVRNAIQRHEIWWKDLDARKEPEQRKKKGGGGEVGDSNGDL